MNTRDRYNAPPQRRIVSLPKGWPVTFDLMNLTRAVMRGDRTAAVELVREAIAADVPAGDALDAMIAAMDEVGERFQRQEMYVPEMLIAARAMKEATAVLEPRLALAGIKPTHTAVIGTVR
ncbi:MAG: B12-binding domain-containing protein, partial [Phycisphaerales bacterium]|nr:B12-binding domain-containing protein [Phycisphaerales bacterium]